MIQDDLFLQNEGNQWFKRNKEVLELNNKFDFTSYLIKLLNTKNEIENILELGCANGYRLNYLKTQFKQCDFVGVDASIKAIQDGKNRYPDLQLSQGLISETALQKEFDLVIVNFVLHWVDRNNLIKSVAEIDRLTKDGGILVIGDFLPDFQQSRFYITVKQKKSILTNRIMPSYLRHLAYIEK